MIISLFFRSAPEKPSSHVSSHPGYCAAPQSAESLDRGYGRFNCEIYTFSLGKASYVHTPVARVTLADFSSPPLGHESVIMTTNNARLGLFALDT